MPAVTIIMPAFRAERTLQRAIESVRRQAFTDWELIVIDDASPDRTGEIARRKATEDGRVRVLVHERNRGAAAAMNLAWRSSTSPLCAILDADDAALPERLARQVEFLTQNPAVAVVGAAAHFVDATGRFLRTVKLPAEHRELAERRWYACPFVHSTVMMRREFLEVTGGYCEELRLGEDYDLWMRGFATNRFAYANLAESLAIYTARPVQRWEMIRASAGVRLRAGRREGRWLRGGWAAARILTEGAVEQTGLFAWRDRRRGGEFPAEVPAGGGGQ